MATILVSYFVFLTIIGAIIFVLFKEFNLNSKIAQVIKFDINYSLFLFCTIFIFILFVFKPNIYDKMKAHDMFVKIDSQNIEQINLIRKGSRNSKRNFKITNTDSISYFIATIQNIDFRFFGGIGGGDYYWLCRIKMKDSSSFVVDFVQGKKELLVIPFYNGRRGESYENKGLIPFLKSLDNISL